MPVVTLAPITRQAASTLRNHGDTYRVLDTRPAVMFSDLPGPWLLLESMRDVEAGKGPWSFAMWVRGEGDADYRIAGTESPTS